MLSNRPQASSLVNEGLVLSKRGKAQMVVLLKNGRDFGVALKGSVITGVSRKDKGCELRDMPPLVGYLETIQYLIKDSSPKTEHFVITYSPSCSV